MKSVKETLNDLLVTLFNNILFIEEKQLKQSGITLSMNEVHVLEAIKNSEIKTMSSVAKILNITLGTLTVSTKKLEGKGYIIKQKDLLDKRIVRIDLTIKAMKVLEIHQNFHELMVDSLCDKLDTKEDLLLIESLDKVNKFFEKNY